MSDNPGLSEDEYLDIVERIQKAAMIEPFCPSVADVVALVGQYRVYERLLRDRDAEVERLRASFDAHHPPNLQQGYRCDVCGEEHPGVISTQETPFNPFAIEDECDADD